MREGSLLGGPPQRGLQGQILNRSRLQQHSEQTPMVEGNCNFRERYVSEMISSGNIRSYLWQELIWARLSQELWRNNHRSRAGLPLTRMAVGAPPSPSTSTSLPPALSSWPGSQQRGQPLGKGSLGTSRPHAEGDLRGVSPREPRCRPGHVFVLLGTTEKQ